MRQSLTSFQNVFAMVVTTWLGLASVASAGDFFVPVETATAGSILGPGLTPNGAINGQGMNDNNAGLKTALSDNQATGFGMWLTDFFAIANGHTDPSSDAWITFDFGEVLPGIDQLLIWNYNQETVTSRGMRQVDITYSTTDATGLGNLLHNDYILAEGTGLADMAYTSDIPLGTPGVGISARSIRITADGGQDVGNYGNAQDFYGLSEARFYSTVNLLPPGPRVWSGGSGSWTFAGSWDIPDAPVTSEHSAIFGDAIEGPATVYANVPVTVNSITFNNANSYAIAGNGLVELDTISGNASINVLGTGDVDGVAGSHQFQLQVALGKNTDVTVGQDSSLDFNNQIDLRGNTLSLSGTTSVNHSVVDTVGGGSVVATGSLGTAGLSTIAAGLVLDDVTLDMDINSTTAGLTTDKFQILGGATLQGDISVFVDAANGFTPTGNISILSTTSGILNNSSSLSLTGPGAGLFSGVSVVGNDLVLLAASSVQGDFDGDGDVDGRDFLVWQRGQTSPPLNPTDLMIWQTNYGAPFTASVASVPEPSTSLLFSIVVSAAGAYPWRRSQW